MQIFLESKINPGDIAATGLSGQQHSSVFMNQYKEVIRHAILWCDQRADQGCQEIHDIFGEEEFIKLAYNNALPGFTAPKILWLRKNEKENLKSLFNKNFYKVYQPLYKSLKKDF